MTVASDIARTLDGRVDRLLVLAEVDDLARMTGDVASWPLSAAAVVRIVEQYSSGAISADQAREWAYFVRHGLLSRATPPGAPIEIEWERAREDAIAEATTRLEELGDLIDGVLRPDEAEELIQLLRA